MNEFKCDEVLNSERAEYDNNERSSPVSKRDRTLIEDSRVIANLQEVERSCNPGFLSKCGGRVADYFQEFQKELKPYMREVVASWMQEVCEDQSCEDQIFPLAVNLLDRFLSVHPITRDRLQICGAVSLLIASKLRQCRAFSVDLLVHYTDYSCTAQDMRTWEMLILSKLGWDLNVVTAHDYIDHLIPHLPISVANNKYLRSHSNTFVHLCAIDPSFLFVSPCLLSVACVTTAVRGLSKNYGDSTLKTLCNLTGLGVNATACLVTSIELAVAQRTLQQQTAAAADLAAATSGTAKESFVTSKNQNVDSETYYGQPETPTDVTEIEF